MSRELLGDKPTARRALVVQGGGLRGVYSMGALAALEDRQLRDYFDVVYGSSAGAINAAYFLAGQSHMAVDVYVEHLSNRHFVNLCRVTKIVDIDYMVDKVLRMDCPLDTQAVARARAELLVVLTDAETAEPFIVSSRDLALDLYDVIRATAALPMLYNRTVRVGDRSYIDGGIADAIPIGRAIADGATTAIAVVTRTKGFRRRGAPIWARPLMRWAAMGQSSAVRERIGVVDRLFNDSMAMLEASSGAEGSLPTRPAITTIWPSDPARLVGRTTSNRQALRDCADLGYEDMQRALDHIGL